MPWRFDTMDEDVDVFDGDVAVGSADRSDLLTRIGSIDCSVRPSHSHRQTDIDPQHLRAEMERIQR